MTIPLSPFSKCGCIHKSGHMYHRWKSTNFAKGTYRYTDLCMTYCDAKVVHKNPTFRKFHCVCYERIQKKTFAHKWWRHRSSCRDIKRRRYKYKVKISLYIIIIKQISQLQLPTLTLFRSIHGLPIADVVQHTVNSSEKLWNFGKKDQGRYHIIL